MNRVLIIVAVTLLYSCSPNRQADEHAGHAHTLEADKEHYTCPMHPDVVQDKPGKCPVCGMDLVLRDENTPSSSHDMMFTDSQIRLANITTERASLRIIEQTLVANGTFVENQESSTVISSRAAGRLERLYVTEAGRSIKKGEPLYELYSESLLTLQREFLLAKDQYEMSGSTQQRYKSFLDAAGKKLVLYGLSQRQVDELARTKLVLGRIPILSPVSGIVTGLNASEGQYVGEGETLMRIANVTTLWMEAALYPAEAALARVGDKIRVKVDGFSEPVETSVDFVSPELRAGTQVVLVRASISNPRMEFRPGMHVQVLLTQSGRTALTLPLDAVIQSDGISHIYIQKGRNTFRPGVVNTGIQGADRIEITAGLNEGDTVAVTGAYLLYSEAVLKNGADPLVSHSH